MSTNDWILYAIVSFTVLFGLCQLPSNRLTAEMHLVSSLTPSNDSNNKLVNRSKSE